MTRINVLLAVLAVLSVAALAHAQADGVTVIQTQQGLLQGFATATHRVFRGIRYAATPVRWTSPQPPASWEGVRNATTFGSVCLQGANVGSEDCLFLNIYVPLNHQSTNSPLPVQVYIHGGGYAMGTGNTYDGSFMSGTDTVFVSINYRLGAWGFLAASALRNNPDSADGAGYYGIQDQRQALRWVQQNIAAFGGNPQRVTVSGNSAGAMCIAFHMVSPRSTGLFQQAIIQSGQLTLNNAAQGIAAALIVTNALNCTSSDDASTLACLKAASPSALLAASAKYYPFQPTALPAEIPNGAFPADILAAGGGNRVPILIGTNLNEQAIGVCRTLGSATQDQIKAQLRGHYASPAALDQLLAAYPFESYSSPTQEYIDEYSDYWFKCPTRDIASAFAKNTNVYMYSDEIQLNYVSKHALGACLGVHHTAELAFFYGPQNVALANSGTFTDDELVLRTKLRNAWVSFIVTGTPVFADFVWPKFDGVSNQYARFSLSSSVGSDFRGSYCNLHAKLAADDQAYLNPTTPAPKCTTVTVSVQKRGDSWPNGNTVNQVYDMYIINNGPASLNSLKVSFSPAVTLASQWNLNRVGDNLYDVAIWSPQAPGHGYSASHGFIATTNVPITASVVAVTCA